MRTMHARRLATIGALTAVMLFATAGSSLAHVCFNAKKPAEAGSAGTATLEVTTGTFTPTDLNMTKSGQLKGGFITLTATAGGTPIATVDTFVHGTRPDGARNAGPGDDMCDGLGIDDAEACSQEPPPAP